MQPVAGLVKTTIPNYLSNLPIPDTFTGWFKLSCKWFNLKIIFYLILFYF